MASLNRVILMGNLGADPEVKTFQDGGKIANFSLATSQKWRDRQTGEARERTEWHRVTIKADGLVGVVERYCRKGSRVLIEGRLETRKWQDQSGADRHTTEVVVAGFDGSLVLCGDPRGGDGGGAASGGGGQPGAGGAGRAAADLDDDIPF